MTKTRRLLTVFGVLVVLVLTWSITVRLRYKYYVADIGGIHVTVYRIDRWTGDVTPVGQFESLFDKGIMEFPHTVKP